MLSALFLPLKGVADKLIAYALSHNGQGTSIARHPSASVGVSNVWLVESKMITQRVGCEQYIALTS